MSEGKEESHRGEVEGRRGHPFGMKLSRALRPKKAHTLSVTEVGRAGKWEKDKCMLKGAMAAGETESDGETGAGGEHRGRAEVLQKGVRFLRMEAPVGVTQPSSHLTLPPAPGIFSGSPLGPAKAWEYPRGEGKNKLHSFI